MKNKFMDVEQLLPHKHLWDRHRSRSFSCGRAASFSPRAASSKSRCGGTSLLKDSLHVWQRQSALVSNNIKQTSCILGLLLISPRIAPSPSWPWLRLLPAPLLKRMKGRRAALRKLKSFSPGFWSAHPLQSQRFIFNLTAISILAPAGVPRLQEVDTGARPLSILLHCFNSWKTHCRWCSVLRGEGFL